MSRITNFTVIVGDVIGKNCAQNSSIVTTFEKVRFDNMDLLYQVYILQIFR